jgi:signal transduction histidine kinase
VSLPKHITHQIYKHYDATEFGIVTLDSDNHILRFNSKASKTLNLHHNNQDIKELLPLLATESLEESFFLPFYNHNDSVYDVHFFAENDIKYIVLVAVNDFHKQVQFKQQLAHDEELEKLKFKALFETLESAQHELITANKSKSFYISALSHEMGNPLNAINGYNQLLQQGDISIEKATKIIDKNVAKLNHIITQALDYDNKNNQQSHQRFKPFNVINDLINDFKIQASQKSLELNNQVAPQILVVSNKTKWQQIFTNLISNAIKYTDHGSITIKSSVEENTLLLDVIDTGCGMSDQFQQQLFSAWSREYKSEAQGNGIGLVISKMLAEQIDAQLVLLSSNEHGSTFRFIFPVDTIRSQKILLVDDDEDCLNLFAFYLAKDHHQITTADSLESLVHCLNSHHFDVIITDLNLGDKQVIQAYDLINSKVKNKIVMTANPTPETQQMLFDTGFNQVLAKPLNETVLRNSVTN